jgi:recA bacterial DNA recombination protein
MFNATMKSVVAKKEVELALAHRFGGVFQQHQKQPAEIVPTGIGEIDARLNGFPRGAITEIHGTTSSGRTTLLFSALAVASMQEETCALVDTTDTFDLFSAANAQVDCDRLLWVRCSGNLERAFKATDLLLQSGGFGLVALNLADVAAKYTRRIITSWWFRFRRAIENTPTVLVVVTPVPCTRSCAALVLEIKNEGPVWPSTMSFVLENNGAKLAMEDSREHSTPHLSLVSETAQPVDCSLLPLTHAHLLQGSRVEVNQERPITWPMEPARFKTRLH